MADKIKLPDDGVAAAAALNTGQLLRLEGVSGGVDGTRPAPVASQSPSAELQDVLHHLNDRDATALLNIGQFMHIEGINEVSGPKAVEDIRPQSPAELGGR